MEGGQYQGGQSFPSTFAGPSFLAGFEQVSVIQDESSLEYEFLTTGGVSNGGNFRIGTAEFVLREAGQTSLSFLTDPTKSLRTLVAGLNFEITPAGQTEFGALDLSTISFDALQVFVVPEPGTAILLGVGLAGLACRRGGRTQLNESPANPA